MEEFRGKLVEFAKTLVGRADRVTNEEAAKQYLVLPLFQFLGYDPMNPDEIVPEAQASFSEKFKNRVDYAVCISRVPVIAVECKKTGELSDGHRGELKGYFNAVPTTKLGILTDGLIYELFSDTNSENMMDGEPFVRINLEDVARERIADQALDALFKLRKGTFDPADVGADAKRKILISKYVAALEENFAEPSEEFARALLDIAGVEGRRTARMLEEQTPIVADALQIFLDRRILERVGFANRQDIVKLPPAGITEQVKEGEPTQEESVPVGSGIITTETEMAVFDFAKTRLAYLVNDDSLFDALRDLTYQDRKTLFTVFYKQERKGRVFNFREGPNGEMRFEFPPANGWLETSDLHEIDEQLVTAFRAAVVAVDQ